MKKLDKWIRTHKDKLAFLKEASKSIVEDGMMDATELLSKKNKTKAPVYAPRDIGIEKELCAGGKWEKEGDCY